MKRPMNLSGRKFGRLTVISEAERVLYKERRWLCKCDCGNNKVILQGSLLTGKTKSCGCLQSETSRRKATKHNLCGTRIYNTYNNMIKRCYHPSQKDYEIYSGRGIKVCDEWLNSFSKFVEWALNNGYDDTLTLDRIDVNGNYEPSNCRWVTYKEQMRNTRRTHFVTYNGETLCVTDWAKKIGVKRERINYYLRKGLNIGEINEKINGK